MNFEKRMQKVQKQSIFSLKEEGFSVWCGSITKGDDDLYYLYFSFWPQKEGHNAWLTHSKIGYAVSESPIGPFEYKGIVLSGAGGKAWDRDCVHNPAVLKVDGVYYLYYMGNYGDGEYWSHRNHQRVGVAWSNKPEGPFQRLDNPIVDIREGFHDSLMTSNPAVCVGPDKKIYMIYKAVENKGELPKGGAVVCGMAVAETPLGEYVKEDHPILVNPENPWSVEDPFIWYEDDRFYVIAKDFQGYFTGKGANSVALFESFNGLDWELSEDKLAFVPNIEFADGEVIDLKRMERPQMWIDENGKPRVLSCACQKTSDPNAEDTFNVQIEIK